MFSSVAEIGHGFLIFAVVLSYVGVGIGAYAYVKKLDELVACHILKWLISFIFILTSLALLVMVFLFYQDDFSVAYIAQHSNRALPVIYKLSAVWSGHEGSILFWLFSLSVWMALINWQSAKLMESSHQVIRFFLCALLILLGLYAIFGTFILTTSNPFERLSLIPLDGRDLNPMLQDIAFISHPPLLYLGYVGLAIPFALSLAAIWSTHIPEKIGLWVATWVRISWFFLTLGIAIGAYWAYYELGWGGFWFWDPVENASLLPWLCGTILLHLSITHARHRTFVVWLLFFGLLGFCCSVLGTFIVRSGIISSVHAFAVEEKRSVFLLVILNSIIIFSIASFILRVAIRFDHIKIKLYSIESAMLIYIWVTILLLLVVSIGTFYPLVLDLLNLNTISVGPPYFNRFFVPSVVVVLIVLLILPKLIQPKLTKISYVSAMFVALLATNFTFYLYRLPFKLVPAIILWLGVCVIVLHLMLLYQNKKGLSHCKMVIAHMGFSLAIIGGTIGQVYHHERHIILEKDQVFKLLDFELTFVDSQHSIGANYTRQQMLVKVKKAPDKELGWLMPEKRYYSVRAIEMSEVGILTHQLSDLHILYGERRDINKYSFKVQYKPMIRLMWMAKKYA